MALRKLQSEIDKTLKKVTEGVELFESIFDKMNASTNATQKEKCETDLKTQIKKLQRLRDQIKSWIASSEIKDKTQLTDTRKLIETQMERFKALEKEMKTKAFSKEGLIAQAKLDPAEKAKQDTVNWLSSMIDELARQVEQAEAEVEVALAGQGKRKGKGAGGERVTELEHLNERRRWHIGRMELVQRMLENGSISVDHVNTTKDDIAYFVESNGEEDFEEDEGIYDELNLQEEEEAFGLGERDDIHSSHDSTSVADDVAESIRTPARRSHPPDDDMSTSNGIARKPSADDVASSTGPKKTPVRKQSDSRSNAEPPKPPIPAPNFAQQPMASALKAGLPPMPSSTGPRPTAAPPLPAIRYAAAAAAAVAPQPTPSASAITPPVSAPSNNNGNLPSKPVEMASPLPSPSVTEPPQSFAAPSPPPSHLSTASSPHSIHPQPQPSPSMLSAQAQQQSQSQDQQQQNQYDARSPVPSHAQSNGASPQPSPQQPNQQQQPSVSPLPPHAATQISDISPSPSSQQARALGQQQQQQQQQQQVRPSSANEGARLPAALADLVSSFDQAKQRSSQRTGNLDQMHSALDASFNGLPRPEDAEKPRYYVPKNPYQTPGYYPQEPFSGFQNPDLYPKMDLDTLFYIFYYHANTYEQWLAARELKKQSWRFHKQYLTWFQRLSQPQAITDDYEQGMYIYFDWENSWCQRKKGDFRFEYRWLEDAQF